jgi:hypothetical protein
MTRDAPLVDPGVLGYSRESLTPMLVSAAPGAPIPWMPARP